MATVKQQSTTGLFLTELHQSTYLSSCLAGTCGQETHSWPARLEYVKPIKSFKYATGRACILTGPVCKMTPWLWHLNPWFLSLSSYSSTGRMLQPKEWPLLEHTRSDYSQRCLMWPVSTSNTSTNAPTQMRVLFLFCASSPSARMHTDHTR